MLISNYQPCIDYFINNNLLGKCIYYLNSGTFDQQKEVIKIIHTLSIINNNKYLIEIYNLKIPEILLNILKAMVDVSVMSKILSILDILLSSGINGCLKYFETLNIIEILENIQYSDHVPSDLSSYAENIVNQYYGEVYICIKLISFFRITMVMMI